MSLYLQHFGLHEAPFALTPDTGFFYAAAPHQEALNVLLVALQDGEGFIKVTGEVGLGKTLLCRMLLARLEADAFFTAYIPNPHLSPGTLRMALAEELGLVLDNRPTQEKMHRQISARLIELAREGKRVVLCLDEAQELPDQTLETVRLLTNLETEKSKLLQVVLFGQPELDKRLALHRWRQLRQRISFSYALTPLDHEAVREYVRHRLQKAGHRGGNLFSEKALALVQRASEGTPRLINILCHKALLAAYGEGAERVDVAHVRRAVADTEGARHPTRLFRRWLPALGGVLIVLGGVAWLVVSLFAGAA